MQNESVAWLEGMFLRPHHHAGGGAQHRRERAAAGRAGPRDTVTALRHISFSRDAIANGQFELSECQARLRDGTVIWIDSSSQPDRVELGKSGKVSSVIWRIRFDQMESIDVFLAVPKLRLGRANTSGRERRATPIHSPGGERAR